jgi:thymidylate kinase
MYNGLYNERASRILLKSVPKPDLTFILDIPEDVSNLRKDDTKEGIDSRREEVDTMDYLKIRREYFIMIAKSLDIPIIDTTNKWNELHEEFFNKIINRYKNKGVDKK